MLKKLLLVTLSVIALSANAQKIVGYLPSYRDPSDTYIQYSKVNTIVYAFINPNATGNLITTTGHGSAWDFDLGHFQTVKNNCATYGVDLAISLGGADVGELRSNRLNAISGNATYRATLVNELVQFAITHNLKGIDVDWEFPKTTTAQDNHELLLAALRNAINNSSNPSIRLGVAVGGEYSGTINHLNYFNNTAVQYVDDFHLMTYDFPDSYHDNHASLTDAQNSFNAWHSAKGVPKSKMYLGVPFYGRNASRSTESEYITFSAGAASYNVDYYNTYYYNGKSTLETKTEWVMEQGGQGIMIWDLGQDRTDAYSLLGAIHDKMISLCASPQPDLGPNALLCSGATLILNSGQNPFTGRTFTWKRNGSVVVNNSLSANTYSITQDGTYTVEITQDGCTRTDEIEVTASSGTALTTVGATRCGPGSVSLQVTSTGGTYDWYSTPFGGAKLYTGPTYTFNAANSGIFYVEDNTTSGSYTAGRASINTGDAWNESGYEASNNLPRFAHKIVVSQPIVIQSLKVWKSTDAISNVRIMAVRAFDGTTVETQSSPVTLPSGNGPHTITPSLSLAPGTYYIGIYAAAPGGPGNDGIWLEPNSSQTSSAAGVFSMEGQVYANYGTGFNAPQTIVHYGQLFDWIITKPTCGRASVAVTINDAANPAISVTASNAICQGSNGTITILNSENGVSYQPYIGATSAGTAQTGNGSNLVLTVNSASLALGNNTITIKATKTGCGTVDLSTTPVIQVNTGTPLSTTGATRCGPGPVSLQVTSTGATYSWYSAATGGTSLHTGSTYSFNATNSGTYYVEGTSTVTNYNGGKTAIDAPSAWNESGYEVSNSLPRFAQKLTVTQAIVLKSVKVWTSANAINNVKIMVIKASDGTSPETESTPVNLPAGGGPHTINADLQLNPGTYYVGVYAAVPGGTDNDGIWLESSTSHASNVAGVFSIEAQCYANYGSGFNAPQTLHHYGQLFDWEITNYAAPSCGRTPVTVTINSNANTGLTVSSVSPVCVDINGSVTVQNSETGVSYQPYIGATSAGTALTGTGSNLVLTVTAASMATGNNTITVKATKTGCTTVDLATTANIQVNAKTASPITFENVIKTYGDGTFSLSASSASAGAFTYSFVSSTPASILTVASNGLVTINGAGTAVVQVNQATAGCYTSNSTTANITVNKATRTVSITSGSNASINNPFNLTYTTSPAGGTATWSHTNGTGSATLSGSVLTPVSEGTVTVQVAIAEDANYNAATDSKTINVLLTQTNQPGTFTTYSDEVTQGQNGVVYTIPNVTGTTYTWTYSGDGATISGTGNSILIDFSATATSGTLSVIADDGSGPSIPRTLDINVVPPTPTSVWASAETQTAFKIYPNPFETSSQIYFQLSSGMSVQLEVYDAQGQKIKTLLNGETLSAGEYTLPLSDLPQGIYMVKLQTGSRTSSIKAIRP